MENTLMSVVKAILLVGIFALQHTTIGGEITAFVDDRKYIFQGSNESINEARISLYNHVLEHMIRRESAHLPVPLVKQLIEVAYAGWSENVGDDYGDFIRKSYNKLITALTRVVKNGEEPIMVYEEILVNEITPETWNNFLLNYDTIEKVTNLSKSVPSNKRDVVKQSYDGVEKQLQQ
jgi:hypothetical protein